jgi:hypothetical protein
MMLVGPSMVRGNSEAVRMSGRKRSFLALGTISALVLVAATAALAQEAAPSPSAQITAGVIPGERLGPPPLDLRAPALTQVFTPATLQLMLVEQQDNEDVADVRVQSERAAPDVPRGLFRAIPWAIMHPTQSWRVITPVTE